MTHTIFECYFLPPFNAILPAQIEKGVNAEVVCGVLHHWQICHEAVLVSQMSEGISHYSQ